MIYIGDKRYAVYDADGTRRVIGGIVEEYIPEGAIRIEYIEFNTSNSLSLSLGFVPDGNTKIELDWALPKRVGKVIFGTASLSDSNDYRCFWHPTQDRLYFDIGSGRTFITMTSYYGTNERFKLYLGNLYESLPDKDVTVTGTSVSYTPYDDSPIGVRNTCIVWGIKAYNGNTPLRDCIPIRIAQKGYMYDKVTMELYEALNSYTLGPDINP